ncbi:hypothetical protein EJ110_NYTH19360 [Nymphaea thermarum]|nr:hypothetical protein EJ110_NYTH19360 [Nymphaea thermarum]
MHDCRLTCTSVQLIDFLALNLCSDTQQNLFTILGLLFSKTIFLAINSCMTVHSVVATERIVMYRERFARKSPSKVLVHWSKPLHFGLSHTLQLVITGLLIRSFGTSFRYSLCSYTTYGDIEKEIDVFGEKKAVSLFMIDYFGFRHDQLGVVGLWQLFSSHTLLSSLLCLLIVYLSLIFREDDYCFPHDC